MFGDTNELNRPTYSQLVLRDIQRRRRDLPKTSVSIEAPRKILDSFSAPTDDARRPRL
jgi:hypothetical protein